MQMKNRLLTDSVITQISSQSQYFIDRYNNVIETYNNSASDTDIYLQVLDNSQKFAKISKFIAHPVIKFVLITLLTFAPIVNLFILGTLFFYYLFLVRQGNKHNKNLMRVKNPMQSYYFLPEICQQLGKHCTTITIKTKDLQGFTFNNALYQQLKAKTQQTDTITVTIYDQYFYDSYHLVKKQQYKIGLWILFAIILITIDIVFYLVVLDLY